MGWDTIIVHHRHTVTLKIITLTVHTVHVLAFIYCYYAVGAKDRRGSSASPTDLHQRVWQSFPGCKPGSIGEGGIFANLETSRITTFFSSTTALM